MKKIISFLLLVTILCFAPKEATAGTIESTSDKVTVTPAKFELWASPGETIEQSLKITNEDTEEGIFALSIESIGVVGEDGEVVMDQTSSTFPNYLSKWTTFSEKGMRLQSKETRIINYKIAVPKDADQGGKYASIVISADRVNRTENNSGAFARVVSLLMVNVAGDFEDRASIETFKIDQSNGGIFFNVRAKNYSVSHIKPEGSIVITNIWGQKIAEVPMASENILPGTIRRLNTFWTPSKMMFGYYTAALVATYGQKQDQTMAETRGFLVISWPISILILLILGLIIYFLAKTKRLKIPKIKFSKFRRKTR